MSGRQMVYTQRLANLPITLFAMVMGLTGLALAWQNLASPFALAQLISLFIAALSSLLFIALLISYAAKTILYPTQVVADIKHPIRINFFPTVSISLLLMAVYWQAWPAIARPIWLFGAALQLFATLFVMSSWLHHNHYQVVHVNPSWFIPVVGNIIAPIGGVAFGFIEISCFFFSVGLLYWLVLFTVILNRLILHESLPPKLLPMMFILLAPPSIGFVSYTLLSGELDTFARFLYYSALFIALLLTASLPRFGKLPFFLSSWAYSFPLAALTVASQRFASLSGFSAIALVAKLLLALLTVLIIWLLIKTVRAALQRQICLPE